MTVIMIVNCFIKYFSNNHIIKLLDITESAPFLTGDGCFGFGCIGR